ncbi:MAG: hypothetical protein AAF805_03595 [Planctomycetota bacterium]
MNRSFSLPAALVVAALAGFSFTADAAPLTGAGPFMAVPSPNPPTTGALGASYTAFGLVDFGFWNPGDVHPDWVGSFEMSGPPLPALSSGTRDYDFTTLPLGYLPAGTVFTFGDVDGGAGLPERFDLTAFDASGTVIGVEWLDEIFYAGGTGTGGGGAILDNNLPGWDWNVTNPNGYQIRASANPIGNPSVTAGLKTNQPIWSLNLVKPTTHYGFGISAPLPSQVPEPTAAGLGCLALVGLAHRRRG